MNDAGRHVLRSLTGLGGFAAGAALGWASSALWLNTVQARTRRDWWRWAFEERIGFFPRSGFFPDGEVGPLSADDFARAVRMNVLGDSAAAGVGASSADRSYVGVVARRLAVHASRPVHVCSIARPGDSSWLLMEHQLPQLEAGHMLPDAHVTLCVIGGNDIADRAFTEHGFEWTAVRLYPRLPRHTVVATIPCFGLSAYERKVRRANALIRRLAAENDLELAELHRATASLWEGRTLGIPRQFFAMESDLFHPNDHGYAIWAEGVWPAVRRAYAHSMSASTPLAEADLT